MLKLLFYLFGLLLFLPGLLKAQNINSDLKEDISFRVFYQHEHLRDRSKPDHIYKENMLLLAGDNHSLFISYDKLMEYLAVEKTVMTELKGGTWEVKLKPGKQIIPEEILMSYSDNEVVMAVYLAKHLHYFENIPELNWGIKDSTKVIEGFNCVYATTHYLGRDWEVWFAPEIALPAGPWLLKGLPGLIMSANDSRGEVKYTFIRMESAEVENEVLKKRKAYSKIRLTNASISKEITKEESKEMLQIARKDFNAFRIAQQMSGELGMTFDYGITNRRSWSDVIPNPIALTN